MSKDFFVYKMKPVKDEKPSTSRAAASENSTEPTAENTSGAPPVATPSTSAGYSSASRGGITTIGMIHREAGPSRINSESTRSASNLPTEPSPSVPSTSVPSPTLPSTPVPSTPVPSPTEPSPSTPTTTAPPPASYADLVTTYLPPENMPNSTNRSVFSTLSAALLRNTGSGQMHYNTATGQNIVPRTERTSILSDDYYHRERRSPTPSLYTLEREVRNYIHKRESIAYQYYPGTERNVYDYVGERTDMYTTNLIESTSHLIKGSLGAGVLSMHEAYMYGGLWTSLGVTAFVGLLIAYSMIMLISSAQKLYSRLRITKLSYPDLAEAAAATAPWYSVRKCSKCFRYLVDACIFLTMCGNCCIYQIMIAYTIKQMVEGIDASITHWLINIRLYILMSAPLLIPMCLIRSLKFMAPFSMIADIFVAMCTFTTLYYSLLTLNSHIEERAAWKDPHGFIRVWGICMFCTSGICVALPVENNMTRPRYFPQAVIYSTIVVILLTIMTGFFGYWAWGETCRSPITVHMPLNIFTTILQFLLILMLGTTFAVQFWVPFRIVWHYLMRKYKSRETLWERIFRFIMAIMIMGVSILFPNLIPVMIFLGQFFLGFIAFIFPAFIELLVDWEDSYNFGTTMRIYRNLKNFVLIVLGLFLSGATFYSVRDH